MHGGPAGVPAPMIMHDDPTTQKEEEEEEEEEPGRMRGQQLTTAY